MIANGQALAFQVVVGRVKNWSSVHHKRVLGQRRRCHTHTRQWSSKLISKHGRACSVMLTPGS